MPRYILVVSLISALLLAALNKLGGIHFLFWRWWWFDMPLHFLGGITLATLGLWFLFSIYGQGVYLRSRSIIFTVLFFVLIIGVGWEIYEYKMGYIFNAIGSYPLDVAKDILIDMLGALLVLYCYRRFRQEPAQP